MADQGDGNHFAFIGELELSSNEVELLRRNGYGDLAGSLEAVEMSCKALVTHHGSRGLGARVYKRGMDAAIKQTELSCAGVPKAAAWLDPSTPEGMEYWEALQYVGRWTEANHRSIHERFLSRSGVGFLAEFAMNIISSGNATMDIIMGKVRHLRGMTRKGAANRRHSNEHGFLDPACPGER